MKKRKLAILIIFSILITSIFAKNVNVGYYVDAGTFMSGISEEVPKYGFAYEYLQNIASYTGWTYTYKYGYFEELYEALLSGQIDILVDISYTPERAKLFKFSSYPMATETYYLYSNSFNNDIIPGELSTIQGKSIALGPGTYQYDLFIEWMKRNNVNLNVEIMPYKDVTEEDFNNGKYDLFLSIDLVSDFDWEPVAKIGSSDVYAVVNNNRPDILEELNSAQNKLYLSDPFYNNNLWGKYFSTTALPKRLTPREHYWMYQHQILSVGCLKEDKPYAHYDSKTHEMKGLIPYMMNQLKEHFDLPNQKFDYHFYNNMTEMDNALTSGEIDVAFPAIYDLEAVEKRNQVLSRKLVSNPLSVIYSSKDLRLSEIGKKIIVMAVPRDCSLGGLLSHQKIFPGVLYEYFDTHEDCLNALLNKTADIAVFPSNNALRLINSSKKFKKLNYTNYNYYVDSAFVTTRDNYELIGILNKLISLSSYSEIDQIILNESIIIDEINLKKFIVEYHPLILLIIFFIVVILIGLFLSLGHVQMLINYDVLTHLLNRRTLSSYMKNALSRARNQNEVFSILIFDLDDFKHINDNYGHAFGDEVLKMAAETISRGIKRSDYAFRWGGEEFLVLLKADKNIAYKVAERIRVELELQEIYYFSSKIKVTTTVGIAAYEKSLTEKELFSIADKNLYKGKNNGKNQVVAD